MTDVHVFAQTIKASLLKPFEEEGNTSLPLLFVPEIFFFLK